MTLIDRTAYPKFKQFPDPKELAELYTPTETEIKFVKSRTKSHSGFLCFMVMLKSFQRLGYFPHPECVPIAVIKHLRSYLKLQDWVKAIPSERQRYNYQNAIREYLGVKQYDKPAQKLIAIAIATSATVKDHPADLINVAIEELVKERYELPAFSTLDRLVGHIRHKVNNRLFSRISTGLSQVEQIYLDQLLSADTLESDATLNLLKSPPHSATLNGVRQLQAKFDALMTFGDAKRLLASIARTKIRHFAAQARALDISEFQDINLPKRRTLLLCLLYEAQVKTRDHLVEMFLRRILKGHESGSEPKFKQSAERYIFTTFGYGCNLGPNQTARHSRGVVTSHMISYTNRRHISTPKIEAAIRDIINAFNRFSLPSIWGTGKKAAADGSKFEIYENNLQSEYHIRYGGYGGIAYHHVSDKYIALFTHFITCGVWEAVYILDGLLKNLSDIQPDTLYADTQGQSGPVFAISFLLGIKLMPRIRNWKDLTFLRPCESATYKYIDLLFKGVVNWNLIKTHWHDMMRVVLSIKAGKVMLRLQKHFHHGSFAEQMLVPTENAIPIGSINPADAGQWCALNLLLVPYGGLLAANLQAGETILISGATGNFGSAGVAVALAMGAGCVVAPGRNEKVLGDLARRFGPRLCPVKLTGDERSDRERMKQASSGAIDCVLDILPPSAGTAPVRAAAMTVREFGRVVLMGGVGMLGGDDLELPYPWIMRNNITIRGQWMYPPDANIRLINLVRSGLLDLSHFEVTKFDLDHANEAVVHAATNDSRFKLTTICP